MKTEVLCINCENDYGKNNLQKVRAGFTSLINSREKLFRFELLNLFRQEVQEQHPVRGIFVHNSCRKLFHNEANCKSVQTRNEAPKPIVRRQNHTRKTDEDFKWRKIISYFERHVKVNVDK